jgi:hypothetical protein
MKLLEIKKSTRANKKWLVLIEKDGKTIIRHFGSKGSPDYTMPPHSDVKRASYIARHSANESYNDPTTPATLSRYLLWEYKSLSEAIKQYKIRFHM